MEAAGWRQGDPIEVELRDGDQTVPLRYFRIEADQGEVAAGAPTVGAANDQDTGENDRALTMSMGDSVSLGHPHHRGDLGRGVREDDTGRLTLHEGCVARVEIELDRLL